MKRLKEFWRISLARIFASKTRVIENISIAAVRTASSKSLLPLPAHE
jgi:hypothetical protein